MMIDYVGLNYKQTLNSKYRCTVTKIVILLTNLSKTSTPHQTSSDLVGSDTDNKKILIFLYFIIKTNILKFEHLR